ncbi:hypothetical protein B0O80DRAFT_452588 [Mortierella sp. GBAus27b]|nr:hypothetical protein B0O80DRAFT_452588 [Mortierella sp. GBAus27b]
MCCGLNTLFTCFPLSLSLLLSFFCSFLPLHTPPLSLLHYCLVPAWVIAVFVIPHLVSRLSTSEAKAIKKLFY